MRTKRVSAARWLYVITVLAVAGALVTGAAVEPKNDYRFDVVGDRTGGHVPGVYERVWREIGLISPDFVINVGDTIEGYVKNSPELKATANQMWDEIDAILRPYSEIPYYQVPGNHDIWADPAEPIYRERTKRPPFYAFRYQDSLFVVLDNSRSNELSEDMYTFLRQSLADNAKANPKFVFFHKPFWIAYVNAGNKDARLHKLCKEFGVTNVITGHGHQLTHMVFDGVDYLEVGSSGGTIGKKPDGSPAVSFKTGRFFHHVLVRVRGSKVQMTVRELDGLRGEGRMFDIQRWKGINPTWKDETDPWASDQPEAKDAPKADAAAPH